MFFITSLIPLQTKLYQTERSLSESWRARSKTRSGFDVASVTASQPWANYRVLTYRDFGSRSVKLFVSAIPETRFAETLMRQ
jgi:hypothetical protein